MNWKPYAPLGVAVVLGLLAARVGMSLVDASGPAITEPTNLVPVLVAARDIDPGTTLAETDFTLAKLPADTLPAGAFTGSGQAAGKVVRIALIMGQTLTPNLLADDGAGYGVGATLPAGMRAVTVDVVETTGVAGFILPQCKVDVLATLLIDGKSISKTVLESVTVLAVGSRTNPTAPNDPATPPSKTVTLLVKPKDAEKVELAATMSRVRLVLRNGRDDSVADSEGITLAELQGRDANPSGGPLPVSTTQPAVPSDITPVVDSMPGTDPFADKTADAPVQSVRPQWTVQVIRAGQIANERFDLPIPLAKVATTKPAAEAAGDEADLFVDVDLTH